VRIARCHADLGVTEDLHHHALVDALSQQQGGSGVPGIMKPRIADVDASSMAFHSPQSARGLIGRPLAWHHTRSLSCHAGPAAIRSASRAARCNRRAATSGGGTATTRRLLADLSSASTRPPPCGKMATESRRSTFRAVAPWSRSAVVTTPPRGSTPLLLPPVCPFGGGW